MPKSKSSSSHNQPIQIDLNGSTLTQENIKEALTQALNNGYAPKTVYLDELYNFDRFHRIREHNRQRFTNYCHKGTILEYGTSKVRWEVIGVEDMLIKQSGPLFTVTTVPKQRIKIRSLNRNANRKNFTKTISTDMHYMYDVIDVPPAVKVLWGDPQDNPPKGFGDNL